MDVKKIKEQVENSEIQAEGLVKAMKEVHKGTEQINSVRTKVEAMERVFQRSGLDNPDSLAGVMRETKILSTRFQDLDKRVKV